MNSVTLDRPVPIFETQRAATGRTRAAAIGLLVVAATGLLLLGCQSAPRPGTIERAAADRSTFVGQTAPDFSLLNQQRQTVTLRDLRGQWVVLYFYPEDDTPGCTCQATEFTALLQSFRNHNARVLGVSGDSPDDHARFAAKYSLRFDLLSDPARDTMTQYGAWTTVQQGNQTVSRVIRTTVIIDPAGRIAAHWPEVIPEGHAKRVRDRLTELQNVQ